MTRDTNEELLLMMLFLGLRLLRPSLLMTGDSAALPSPNARTLLDGLLPFAEAAGLLVSLLVSIDTRDSFSNSFSSFASRTSRASLASLASLDSLASLVLVKPKVFHRSKLLVAVGAL